MEQLAADYGEEDIEEQLEELQLECDGSFITVPSWWDIFHEADEDASLCPPQQRTPLGWHTHMEGDGGVRPRRGPGSGPAGLGRGPLMGAAQRKKMGLLRRQR